MKGKHTKNRPKKVKAEVLKLAVDLDGAHDANRLALEATERFITSGVQIKDVYGKLDK